MLFSSYDLSEFIEKKETEAHQKVDQMTNEEIMADDIEVLAEKICQEFSIAPVKIHKEDASKRSIRQVKTEQKIPSRSNQSRIAFHTIDGVSVTFFYPYTGDSILFRCFTPSCQPVGSLISLLL